MSITPHTKATATISVLVSVVVSMFILGMKTSTALGEKANQTSLDILVAAIGNKADKREVDVIRDELNELSAKRREDSVKLTNIDDFLKKMDSKLDVRMSNIEQNQQWQIQQEVKRRPWEPFKQEATPTPTPNANR